MKIRNLRGRDNRAAIGEWRAGMRRRAAPVAVTFASVVMVACSGSSDDGAPSDTSSPTSTDVVSTTTSPPMTTTTTLAPTTTASPPPASLPPVPNQQQSIVYEHPDLGPVTVSIAYPPITTEFEQFNPTVAARVNATGETVYEWVSKEPYEEFRFAGGQLNPDIANPVDARGHLFFEWNPGRLPGVSYLLATTTGFDANGTLGDTQYDGHYDANIVDTDSDGNYEIEQHFQRCEPDCASGGGYTHTWPWDGSAYTGSEVDPEADANAEATNNGEYDGDPSLLEPAKQLFKNYLLAAGARDYKKAWGMLAVDYQQEYGSYEKFVKFWDGIDSVGIDSIDSSMGEGSTSIDAVLWYQLKNGTRQRESVLVQVYGGLDGEIAGYQVLEVLD